MFNQIFNTANYYFNPYVMPIILVSAFILSIGLFVLDQNRRSIINMAFFLQCFSVSFWLFTISVVYSSRTPQIALFWYRYFTFFAVVNIMPSVYLFATAWTGEFKQKRVLVLINYLIPLIFYGIEVTTNKIILPTGIRHYFWGFYPIYSKWAGFFVAFFLVQFFIGFKKLYFFYKHESTLTKKRP